MGRAPSGRRRRVPTGKRRRTEDVLWDPHEFNALDPVPDRFQFYLQDESAEGDLSDRWTDEARDRLLAVAPGTLGVGTVRNMKVLVRIDVLEGEPPHDVAQWDHITECSIQIDSGRMVVAGCMDYFPEATRIPLAPGCYAVRVSYGGLASLSVDGLNGDDHYRVQLWPGVATAARVLKQRAAR